MRRGHPLAAATAAEIRIPIPLHLFPEFPAQLLRVTPEAHWLEYVDWASAFLAESIETRDGAAHVPDAPGSKVSWNKDAVHRLAA